MFGDRTAPFSPSNATTAEQSYNKGVLGHTRRKQMNVTIENSRDWLSRGGVIMKDVYGLHSIKMRLSLLLDNGRPPGTIDVL